MPITVAHEPSFLITGQYAYRSARQQAQNQVAREQRQAEQRDADRQANAFNNLIDNQFALQKSREDAQADLAKTKQTQEFQYKQASQKEAALQQRDANRFQNTQALQEQKAAQDFQVRGVATMEKAATELQQVLANPNMTPEGKRIAADLNGKLRAIQKQRTLLPPDKYGALMGQWLNEVDRSGIEAHEIKIPTVEESWRQDSITLPDGTIVAREKNHNGDWTYKKIADGGASKPKNEHWGAEYNDQPDHAIPHDVYFRDPEKRTKAYDAAKKALEAQAQKEADEAQSKGEKTGDFKLVQPRAVGPSEIYAEMVRAREEDQKFMAQLEADRKKREEESAKAMAEAEAQKQPGQPGQAPPIPPGEDPTPLTLQPPPEPQKAAPGKPAVNPAQTAPPPGPSEDGSFTVHNKDKAVTFASPEDAKKAAQAATGLQSILFGLVADEMQKRSKQVFGKRPGKQPKSVAKAEAKQPTKVTPDSDEPIRQTDEQAKFTNYLGGASKTAEKYKDLLPRASRASTALNKALKKYGPDINQWDPKALEELESSDDSAALLNLHEYELGKLIPKSVPKDRKKFRESLTVGDIYYTPDPKDPKVTHDVIWDGSEFKIIASYKSKE